MHLAVKQPWFATASAAPSRPVLKSDLLRGWIFAKGLRNLSNGAPTTRRRWMHAAVPWGFRSKAGLNMNEMKKRQIQISLPSVGDEEWQAVREPLTSGWLTQGPKVAAFEKAFAGRHRVKHALATTSCTTGLHLILAAMGIGPGDEVIVPAFTWIATPNVVRYCGATPVLADVDRTTYNVDPADIARRLSSRTKAVIVVHLFGLCADMDALRAVLPPDIPIIEDAAC